MILFRRPWSLNSADATPLGPGDCFLSEGDRSSTGASTRSSFASLMTTDASMLRLHPYPRTGEAVGPPAVAGLPARPRTGHVPRDAKEESAALALQRMHQVLARIEDLDDALNDPEHLWERLGDAWQKAEGEADPQMSEIVRQARRMPTHLKALDNRLRRVLRRNRELMGLDRVQEMDRGSMIWLARQPGNTTVERAGSTQRILAIARHENFDTLENRVLHAYVLLAARVARQWMREQANASATNRYRVVSGFDTRCRRMSHELAALGVSVAEPGIVANYVLMQERNYAQVMDSWIRLLRLEMLEDDLWAWQAQSWTDFCVLAVTLALHQMPGAETVAQSPLVWLDEAEAGRRFLHDRPLAVFWLKKEGLVVEVQARPESVSRMQFVTRAWLWLRISDLADTSLARRVPIWTPHMFAPMDLSSAVADACNLLQLANRIRHNEIMREGLILTPAHGAQQAAEHKSADGRRVAAVALDASGDALRDGMLALANFVRSCVGGNQ